MANKRKQPKTDQPKTDPSDLRYANLRYPAPRMSDMSQEELEELFRSEGLPPPLPLGESRI